MKDIVINSSVFVLSSILCLLVLEGALELGIIDRANNNFKEHVFCRGPNDRGKFHDKYGWIEHSKAQYLERKSKRGEWHFHTYNSKGFRDIYNSGQDTILILGDSFTRGTLADDTSNYPQLLDRWTPNTSFINYGVGGYGTFNELALYNDRKKNHELVILTYYMNDLEDNGRKDVRMPKFTIKKNRLVKSADPRKDKSEDGYVNNDRIWGVQHFLANNTEFFPFLKRRIRVLVKNVPRLDRIMRPEPPRGTRLDSLLKLTRYSILKIGKVAKRRGADMLIVTIPSRSVVNESNPSHYAPRTARSYYRRQLDMIRRVSSNKKWIYILNVEPILSSALESDERVYGKIDSHLNEFGYRILARNVAKWLKKKMYVYNVDKGVQPMEISISGRCNDYLSQ